jgi:uncharacterized membrane protein YhfC
MIPSANIVTVVVLLLLSVALPLAACLITRKATRAGFLSLFIDMAVFFVCFLTAITTQLLFSLLIGSQILLVVIGALRAGLVEESARFLAFKFFLRKKQAIGDSVMYGVGHGGMEVLLVYTLTMISNLSFMMMINAGMLDTLIASAPEQATILRDAVDTLANAHPLLLSLGFFERISAMILHVSFSVLVFCAVRQRRPLYFVLAILMHALADSLGLLLVNGWVGTGMFEVILFVVAVAYALIAWRFALRYIAESKTAAEATV